MGATAARESFDVTAISAGHRCPREVTPTGRSLIPIGAAVAVASEPEQ